jgi:hypothetical protein
MQPLTSTELPVQPGTQSEKNSHKLFNYDWDIKIRIKLVKVTTTSYNSTGFTQGDFVSHLYKWPVEISLGRIWICFSRVIHEHWGFPSVDVLCSQIIERETESRECVSAYKSHRSGRDMTCFCLRFLVIFNCVFTHGCNWFWEWSLPRNFL